MEQTQLLILRKMRWKESGLIVSGISPDYGRLDAVLHGALASGKKKFPAADLFRVVRVEFTDRSFARLRSGESSMATAGSVELIRSFDSLAEYTEGYLAACAFAPELLGAARPMLEAPAAFLAAQWYLENLASGKKAEPYLSMACLVILEELGEMPPVSGRSGEFLNKILQCVYEDKPLPENIPESYWERLTEWRRLICRKYFPGVSKSPKA